MSGTNLPAPEVPTIVSGTPPAAPEPIVAPSVVETPTIITPSSAPVELPVAETVVVEPVAAEPVVEGAEKPAETPTPAEGADAKPELHTDKPTLLETKEGEAKPEAKPAEGEKKPDEAAEAFKYEPFKLPDGVKIDEPTVAKFTEIVGPHKLDQETAQKLVDLHSETLNAYATHLSAEQHRVFAETRVGWVQKIHADPILGGAGHQTALQAAARMRDLLVPEEHRAEFDDFMRVTGAGDHPALFRLLHTAARLYDEPAAPPIPARPIPDRGGQRMSKGEVMYDHPSSRRVASR